MDVLDLEDACKRKSSWTSNLPTLQEIVCFNKAYIYEEERDTKTSAAFTPRILKAMKSPNGQGNPSCSKSLAFVFESDDIFCATHCLFFFS